MKSESILVNKAALQEVIEKLQKIVKGQTSTKIVNESNFFMNYEPRQTPKLGLFQVASREGNETNFDTALKVLKKFKATISHRYHGNDYNYSYWFFGSPEKIFRQKLNK